MSRLSIELIPRGGEALLRDDAVVRDVLPDVTDINIPDLLRLPLRSWQAVRALREHGAGAASLNGIPHIRAIDIDPDRPLPGADDPVLREILVIAGDPPQDMGHRTWPNTTVDIIGRYRRELPHLKVYAAFDPYRRAPYRELEDIRRKKAAGACGFFTQPLFDRRMLELSASWLEDETVFWGVSPVIGPKSRAYWERVNRVVFPRDFNPSLQANIAFAQDVLRFARERGDSAYLMPVKVDLATYLAPLQEIFRMDHNPV